MTALRAGLPQPIPANILALSVDERGYPVPWFVAEIDGKPDFRVVRGEAPGQAVNQSRCWICGRRRPHNASFLIGPMCAVNRVSSEPPMHEECARWSAIACPFLTRPKAVRRESGLDNVGAELPPGEMISRNPGVTLLWRSSDWTTFRAEGGRGFLFNVGTPNMLAWFAEGRAATRDEVMASIQSGLPLLQKMAADEGVASQFELKRRTDDALKLVPAA